MSASKRALHAPRTGAGLTDSAGDPGHLASLLGRIAAEDTRAFAQLYALISPQLSTRLRSTRCEATHAPAVMAATFVELWMLARFHTSPDTDVLGWITDIVTRRADEQRRLTASRPPGEGRSTAADVDTYSEHLLARLLGNRRQPPRTR